MLRLVVEATAVEARTRERSCVTCAHFNASYSICDIKGHIGRPTYTQCSRWVSSEKDAQGLYERILRMLKIPIEDRTE